jgi:APA family basic amino acid/polyamine antiporter
MGTKAEPAKSRRAFGFWICLALVMGNMIGSGVFLLPQQLAPYGWNAVLGWAITIAGALCLAFVFASLARAIPRAGGPYAYTAAAFGTVPGFAVAWSYWISVWTANATIAVAAVSYLSHVFPALAVAPGLFAIGLVWTFTLVNCLSVKGAGEVQVVTTALKLLPLLAAIWLTLLVAAGGAAPPTTGDGPSTDIGWSAVTASAALALWAMVGFESATIPAGHVREPERTIPRATMWGTFATGLVYLIACSGVALLLPPDVAANSSAPFADFIGSYWGAGAALFVALFAAISCLGALNGWVLIQGEMPLALARDGMFPAWLAKTSASGAPVRAHLVSSLLVTALLLANQSRSMGGLFAFMALLSTCASLVAYVSCSLGALRLQRQGRMPRTTLLTAAAAAGLVYSIWALYGAGAEPVLWGAALLVSGIPVFLLTARNRNRGPAVLAASTEQGTTNDG